jgi:hypothetical protein
VSVVVGPFAHHLQHNTWWYPCTWNPHCVCVRVCVCVCVCVCARTLGSCRAEKGMPTATTPLASWSSKSIPSPTFPLYTPKKSAPRDVAALYLSMHSHECSNTCPLPCTPLTHAWPNQNLLQPALAPRMSASYSRVLPTYAWPAPKHAHAAVRHAMGVHPLRSPHAAPPPTPPHLPSCPGGCTMSRTQARLGEPHRTPARDCLPPYPMGRMRG